MTPCRTVLLLAQHSPHKCPRLWPALLRLQARAAHQGLGVKGLDGVTTGLQHALRHAVPWAIASGCTV